MGQQSAAALALMPDIAQESLVDPEGELSWVGMNRIHQPIRLQHGGVEHQVQATVDAYVDLTDPHAKGIHMSRLYLQLDEHSRQHSLSPASMKMLLNAMLQTHHDISGSARLRFEFDFCVQRPALKSQNMGWNSYPVSIDAVLDHGVFSFELGVEIMYSSTCPCSAALARQLIQESFDGAFDPSSALNFEQVRAWLGTQEGIVATPHSQRSVAAVEVRMDGSVESFPIVELIDALETTLATPVQTAVKREDEQEFALRNGQNLMFCEDAARKLKRTLQSDTSFADYRIRIEHQESLHAHDAVAIAVKGVEGGFKRTG
jgi:GTP cyclohydrolase I